MAITKTVTKQTLTLNVEDGVNSQGAAKTKGHNYAGVRPEAEPGYHAGCCCSWHSYQS